VVVTLEANEPSRSAKRRLLKAVNLRASIRHPNLARALPLGRADGRLFVDLELPSHPTLAERLAAAPLDPAECVRILEGVAAGAAALQERGLVPRDVTPGDVVVHPADGGILMDLGIPPKFVRPATGEPTHATDARSRVHSLGAVLFTALTGVAPNGKARSASLRPEIDQVIARAMAADPADRYADLTELSQAAGAALGMRPAAASAPSNGNNGTQRPRQQASNGGSGTPRRNGHHPESGHATGAPRVPGPSKARPTARPALALRALAAAGRRCADLVVALVAVAAAAGERLRAQCAQRVVPTARAIASGAGRVPRRSAEVTGAMLASTARVVDAVANRTAKRPRGLAWAGRVAIERSRAWQIRSRITWFAAHQASWRRAPGSVLKAAGSPLRRGTPALVAAGAIAASVVAGTAIGGSVDVKEGPTAVTRSGLAVLLPDGWKETTPDAEWSGISPAFAAGSSESKAGLVVGKLGSLGAAERVLGDLQGDGQGQTPVRLGSGYAWRYSGLRPGRELVGSAYAVPTTAGAVVFVCHAPRTEASVGLAQCNRAATTLVLRGEESRSLSALSESKERLIRVIATLRSSRSEDRRLLVAADRPREQVRAATSLERDYLRAARSLEGLPPLENGRPLDGVSAALREVAAAYGSLADAAESGRRSAYREAGHTVVLKEEGVRRELAHASGA
jgi:hypothetical protein